MSRLAIIGSAFVALAAAAPAAAQVSIGPNGIRAGNTVIDGAGVHTGGTSVTATGVSTRGGTTISGNGNSRSIDCGGGRVSVNGNGNRLRLTDCRDVTLSGNRNDVRASFIAPGRIAIVGNRNQLVWSAPRGVAVRIDNVGTANRVARR